MLKARTWVWTLGLLFAEIFVMFVIRDLISPLSISTRRFLEIVLPGFRWLTPGRFLLGLTESFLWGVYLALVLAPAANIYLLSHSRQDQVHERPSEHKAAA